MSKPWRRRDVLGAIAGGGALFGTPLAWAAAGSGQGSLKLVFYTDVHARVEWDTPRALSLAAAAMNKVGADMVFAGGDLVTDGFQAPNAAAVAPRWDAYMAMHNAIDGEIHAAMGPHDMVAADPDDGSPPSNDPRAEFRTRLGLERTYYSFDALGYHFIILDSIEVSGDKYRFHGKIWPREFAWLEQDLATVAKDTPIVVVVHVPLLTAFYNATDGATTAARSNRVIGNNVEVLDLFADHNLHLVLQGHMHAKEMIRWRDTTFITGGALSGKWWRGPWLGTDAGFNVITLKEGHIEWDYWEYGWIAQRPVDE